MVILCIVLFDRWVYIAAFHAFHGSICTIYYINGFVEAVHYETQKHTDILYDMIYFNKYMRILVFFIVGDSIKISLYYIRDVQGFVFI